MTGDNTLQRVAQARQGDDDAFAQLVETYQKPVYYLCYRMLGDSCEAEDAAQETFLRAYKNIHLYDASRSFITWLLSIASHYCIDQLRRRRMKIMSLESHLSDSEEEIELEDMRPTPEMMVRIKEEQQKVQRLLKTLEPTERAAIILLYWYEYSYEEIANTLTLSVSAVKSRLHRARRQLAEVWQTWNNQSEPVVSIKTERKRYELPVF
jgi:RNA polymerase sigma-70 factor (ECF subfamily)